MQTLTASLLSVPLRNEAQRPIRNGRSCCLWLLLYTGAFSFLILTLAPSSRTIALSNDAPSSDVSLSSWPDLPRLPPCVVILTIALLLLAIALPFYCAKVIGTAIKSAIEAANQTVLGVDITVKQCAVNLFTGCVRVQGLVVHQPVDEKVYERLESGELVGKRTGKECEWKYDYIAKIDSVLIKINIYRTILTLGKEFELECLSPTGVHVNIEKPNTDLRQQNSNLGYIINHWDSLGLLNAPETSSPEELNKISKIILHKIILGDITVGVTIRGVPVLHEISFHPSVGLIEFDDVQRDVLGGRENLTPGETVACIIIAIARKIFMVAIKEIPGQLSAQVKSAMMQRR